MIEGRESGPDPAQTERAAPTPSARTAQKSGLTAALRRARIENAERADAIGDIRSAEIARLQILRDHLAPVFDEIPADCDLFDPGLAPGERPRLFIDMVAFVELAPDRRTYVFLQDSRAGRSVLAESERIDALVRAVTDYIARRIVERERALATLAAPMRPAAAEEKPLAATKAAGSPLPRTRAARVVARSFLFLVEVVGSAVVFGAIGAACLWFWQRYVK